MSSFAAEDGSHPVRKPGNVSVGVLGYCGHSTRQFRTVPSWKSLRRPAVAPCETCSGRKLRTSATSPPFARPGMNSAWSSGDSVVVASTASRESFGPPIDFTSATAMYTPPPTGSSRRNRVLVPSFAPVAAIVCSSPLQRERADGQVRLCVVGDNDAAVRVVEGRRVERADPSLRERRDLHHEIRLRGALR